jgi:uncharacterized DUF497 family protein
MDIGYVWDETKYKAVVKEHNVRLLSVVYTEQDLPLYRIITAFDAEGKWRDEYYQR